MDKQNAGPDMLLYSVVLDIDQQIGYPQVCEATEIFVLDNDDQT